MTVIARARFGVLLLWRSLRVVGGNRGLIAYPILSWLSFVGSAVALGAIFAGETFLPRVVDAGPQVTYWLGVADVAVAALGGAVLTTLFNGALVSNTVRSLRFEHPRARDGLYAGLGSFDRIVVWAVVSSSVGVVFHLAERLDPTGRAVGTLLGRPWANAALLALPVIAFEDVRLDRLFERSRGLFRKRWGESTGASLGVDLVLSVVALAVAGVVWYVRTRPVGVPVESVTVAGVVALAVVLLLRQIAVGVGKAAAYIYATTGRVPEAFEGLDFSTIAGGPARDEADPTARPET